MKTTTERGLLVLLLLLSVTGCGTVMHATLENRSGTDILLRTTPGCRNPGYEDRQAEIRIGIGETDQVSLGIGQHGYRLLANLLLSGPHGVLS